MLSGVVLSVFGVLPLSAEAITGIDTQQIQELAAAPEWHALLHIDASGTSAIDDPSFFLAENPGDPEKEIVALLQQYSQATVERFPARYLFLAEQLDLEIPFTESDRLATFQRTLNPASISVLFASAYLGSPMSYFGHTLIKFNKAENPFFSQVFGFAAELPDTISTPSLIVNGLTGNLPGRYSFGPFFLVADRYLRTEQRYLIEYELNLTAYQRRLLAYHAWELMHTSFSYHFLTQNCTSELMPLLSVVLASTSFQERVFGLVTPYDLIAAIEQIDGVSDPTYHYPSVDRIQYVHAHLSPAERRAYHEVLRGSSKTTLLDEIDDSDIRETVAYLLSSGTDLRFRRFGIKDGEYRAIDHLVYPQPTVAGIPPYTPITRPMKISSGVLHAAASTRQTIGFRPFYFNRREDRPNRLADATLEFLSGTVSTDYTDLTLEELTFLRIESFPRCYSYFPMPSWRLATGFEKRTAAKDLNYTGEFGAGISLGGSVFSLYGLPNIVYLVDRTSIGIEALFGTGLWLKQLHLGYDAKLPLWFTHEPTEESHELYAHLNLTDRLSVSGSFSILDCVSAVAIGVRL